ncbi:Uncharacterised protein [Neisseria gonorrhoeae]|uniref:Uncharacterized protein n=1 Tax=Neisseria gonorrhoeae TaxID=485 RepID=A0A378VZ75_NEIGO|nr:Uncharacterised protein [Neisseria gonorrhoeae]
MPIEVKLYYAKCITANRYLFSYGRKPKGEKLKALCYRILTNKKILIISAVSFTPCYLVTIVDYYPYKQNNPP